MTFLEAINRILRLSAIIRGDTDTITTFNDIAHNASLNIGILAVQNELVRLVADTLLPRERKTTGTITLSTNTRVYNLPSDFIRFYGGNASFYNATANRRVYPYAGGLDVLQHDIYNYSTQYGQPNWWYWEPSTSAVKQIGFFQVPSGSEHGQVWTFDYEGSVMVSSSTDELPFNSTEECYAFVEMCGRRFKFMFEDTKNEADIQRILDADSSYRSAKATLFKLIKGLNPARYWGHYYA